MTFRRARSDERELLDEMTLAGIRHWGHHEHFPDAYAGLVEGLKAEDGPENHPVFVLEEDGRVVAFYELRDRGDQIELLRMFMRTDRIGHGYGRILWDHAVSQATLTHQRMLIMSDPEAIGFYAAMGASLERRQEISPGLSLGVFSYDLTSGDTTHTW